MTDIRIVTYNVLAAVFVKKQYYPRTSANLLDYRSRREHTLRFVEDSSADFVLLQEAQDQDRLLFENHLPSRYSCSSLGNLIRIEYLSKSSCHVSNSSFQHPNLSPSLSVVLVL